MPRDSNGVYSLPVGTIVSTGETILPSQHNPAMLDIAAALTASMPRGGGSFTGVVSFPAGISGSVTFTGNIGAASITVTTLGVTGPATFSGPASFSGGISGSVTFSGNVGAANFSTSGSVGVGTTLTVAGVGNFGGTVTAPLFSTSSDRRLKTEVKTLDGARMLEALNQIGGKSYLKNGVPELGVIAQDVQAAGLSELTIAGKDGMWGVNYSGFVGVLIAALCSLAERVKILEGEDQ